jgi:L-2-hydroxycarboxylate dehydrogenase (NAD+)
VRESGKAKGQERIFIHGEKEAEKRAESMADGIMLDAATWKLFDDYAAKFGLDLLQGVRS